MASSSLPLHTEYDYLFKVLLVGDSSVGKSSIVNRYVDDFHDPRFLSTIGVDFKIRTYERNGKIIKLQIWDTAGQERFRSITTSYYRGADGIIMVYDVNQPQSLDSVQHTWAKEVQTYARRDPKLLLVGNKTDLRRAGDQGAQDATAMQARINELMENSDAAGHVGNIETSAKTGDQVEEAFNTLVDAMVNDYVENRTLKDQARRRAGGRQQNQHVPYSGGGINLLRSGLFSGRSSLCCGLF